MSLVASFCLKGRMVIFERFEASMSVKAVKLVSAPREKYTIARACGIRVRRCVTTTPARYSFTYDLLGIKTRLAGNTVVFIFPGLSGAFVTHGDGKQGESVAKRGVNLRF